MKILVCGGREFGKRRTITDEKAKVEIDPVSERECQYVYKVLDSLVEEFRMLETIEEFRERITIIQGEAEGADTCAKVWAKMRGAKLDSYPADWKTHGKNAGPMRNQRMLDEGKPDIVIAFPGGGGTINMCNKARMADVYTRCYVMLPGRKLDPVEFQEAVQPHDWAKMPKLNVKRKETPKEVDTADEEVEFLRKSVKDAIAEWRYVIEKQKKIDRDDPVDPDAYL